MENKGKWTIAKRLGVSLSTVERILERFGRYGHVRLAKIGRPDISRLLTKAQLLVLMDYVLPQGNGSIFMSDNWNVFLLSRAPSYSEES